MNKGEKVYIGKVAGISFSPAKENFKKVMEKFNSMPVDKVVFDLSLRHDPENPYDANAVEVLLGQKGEEVLRVGFVPKPNNQDVLREGIDNVDVEVVNFNRMDNKVVGMDILVSKRVMSGTV